MALVARRTSSIRVVTPKELITVDLLVIVSVTVHYREIGEVGHAGPGVGEDGYVLLFSNLGQDVVTDQQADSIPQLSSNCHASN